MGYYDGMVLKVKFDDDSSVIWKIRKIVPLCLLFFITVVYQNKEIEMEFLPNKFNALTKTGKSQ